jgi:hypothetical protein
VFTASCTSSTGIAPSCWPVYQRKTPPRRAARWPG